MPFRLDRDDGDNRTTLFLLDILRSGGSTPRIIGKNKFFLICSIISLFGRYQTPVPDWLSAPRGILQDNGWSVAQELRSLVMGFWRGAAIFINRDRDRFSRFVTHCPTRSDFKLDQTGVVRVVSEGVSDRLPNQRYLTRRCAYHWYYCSDNMNHFFLDGVSAGILQGEMIPTGIFHEYRLFFLITDYEEFHLF